MLYFISHKGNGNHGFASNTKEAIFHILKNKKISGVEFDIRLTKDNKFVIIHDPIIDFVSDGTGIVKYMTLSKLKKYNFGTKQCPSKIATLEEVLKKIKTNQMILIEIKTLEYNENIIKYLYPIIKKYQYLNMIIISFHQETLTKLKQKDSTIKCGLLIGYFLNNNHKENYDYYLYHEQYIEKAPYSNHNFFYTINHKKQVNKIKQRYHKAYIITDYPETLSIVPPIE